MIVNGNALRLPLSDGSVHCAVTSPPYWGLRNYGISGQLGLERTPQEYVENMVAVFREVWRVLRDDGTLWLNLGDSYARNGEVPGPGASAKVGNTKSGAQLGCSVVPPGLKPKDLVGIPWRVAFALQADGWYLRSDIIWAKPNPMPESVTDRPTKAHEYVFLLAKQERYWYDAEAVKEPQTESTRARAAYGWNGRTDDNSNGARTGSTFKRMAASGEPIGTIPADGARNRRTVWTVATQPYSGAHFATWPPALVEPMILAGCPQGGIVLDPFCGSGTTGQVARRHGRRFVGVDLNPAYLEDLALARAEGLTPQKALEELPLFGGGGGDGVTDTNKQDALGKRTYTGFNARWKAANG